MKNAVPTKLLLALKANLLLTCPLIRTTLVTVQKHGQSLRLPRIKRVVEKYCSRVWFHKAQSEGYTSVGCALYCKACLLEHISDGMSRNARIVQCKDGQ